MRTALLCSIVFAVPGFAQDKPPQKLTAENIEVGKTGTIDRLVVEKVFVDEQRIIARFDGLRVLIADFPVKDVGKGKVLPKTQVWRVVSVIDRDSSGNDLGGCYMLKPEKKK